MIKRVLPPILSNDKRGLPPILFGFCISGSSILTSLLVLKVSQTLRMSLTVEGETMREREGTSAFMSVVPLKALSEAHKGEVMGSRTWMRK